MACAEHHAHPKTRRKTEIQLYREKPLSRKTRFEPTTTIAVLATLMKLKTITAELVKKSKLLNDCEDQPVKDELESLEDTFLGYYQRVEAYRNSGQGFQCNTFVRQVQRIKRLFERNNGLAHYCEFRWFVKGGGWFSENTIERMHSCDKTIHYKLDAESICDKLKRDGDCRNIPSVIRDNADHREYQVDYTWYDYDYSAPEWEGPLYFRYCEIQTPCHPHCEKCNESIVRASRFLNYASNDLAACHLQLQNVNGRK